MNGFDRLEVKERINERLVKRIYIHRNSSENKELCILQVQDGVSMKKFALAIDTKLGIKAKRFFLSNGGEVFSVEEMEDGDQIYISLGEIFYKMQGPEQVQIAVLGFEGVGKSALCMRFVKNTFVDDWDPTIEDMHRKQILLGGKQFVIDILDTAGQEDFLVLRSQWMNGKDAIIFVYSLTPKQLNASINELDALYDVYSQIHLNEETIDKNSRKAKVPLFLIGNKKDTISNKSLQRTSNNAISQGTLAAKKMNAYHYETSAKTGENVDAIFEAVIQTVIKSREELKRFSTEEEIEVPKCSICNIL